MISNVLVLAIMFKNGKALCLKIFHVLTSLSEVFVAVLCFPAQQCHGEGGGGRRELKEEG